MKTFIPLVLLLPTLLIGCGKKDDISNDSAGAASHEPHGGSMSGAGGAGPGYDGSGHGGGKYGTVPTNSSTRAVTNQ